MNFDILNNKPLEFFNESGELIGTISVSGSGDMLIRPESGSSRDIILGDPNTVGDVEIGLPSAPSTLKLMGGGTISSNGNTLTIGDLTSGDSVIVRNSTSFIKCERHSEEHYIQHQVLAYSGTNILYPCDSIIYKMVQNK